MSFYLKLFSIFAALLFSACATLDKGECQVADWQLIGFSDGSNGRLSDGRMDKHTSACAKHNIISKHAVSPPLSKCPDGEIGRRKGLKNHYGWMEW